MQIPEEILEQVKSELNNLSNKVVLKVFTKASDCDYCKDTLSLTNGVANLLEMVSLEEYDIEKDKALAEKYGIEQTPAILVHNEAREWPIRFYGIPAGYEFSSLIESIKYVGTGEIGLPENIIQKAKSITSPKNIKVFVTVNCPYCPSAVITGFKLALANPQYISAQMVEASEFPDLSNKYQVRAVPKIVMNETVSFEGALTVEKYLQKLIEA